MGSSRKRVKEQIGNACLYTWHHARNISSLRLLLLISRIQQFGGKGIYLSVNTDFYHSCLLCKVKSQQILQFIKFGLGAHNLTYLKPNLTEGLAHDKPFFQL